MFTFYSAHNFSILQQKVNMLLRRNLIQVFTRNYAKQHYKNPRTDVLTSIFIDKPDVIKWGEIRDKMLENAYSVNLTNVDSLIISKCFNGARLDIAKSYMDYLKSNNLSISDAFIIKLIRLYYARYRTTGELSKKDSDELLSYCNMISDKFQFLDPLTAENLIHGLSLTSNWREAEKYFEMIIDKTPDKSTYSAFISRAIVEDDEKLVWKYLNEMASRQQLPRTFIFIEWFKKHQNDKTKINQMLQYISEHGLLMPEIDVNEFSNALKKNYNCSLVTINRKGKCPSCASQLPGVKLMDSEFQKIAVAFLEDIIIKSDVFIKSNPQEVERFKTFVEKTKPYDCVIDGLNVAFSQGNRLPTAVYAKILAQVVKHFADQKQKCLVIGRKYMDGWPRKEMSFIKANSKLFLVEDLYVFKIQSI